MSLAMCVAENRVASGHHLWDDSDLLAQFDITQEQLTELRNSPKFCKAVNECVYELKRSGGAIESKAERLFEYYLENYIPKLMDDPDAAHSDKLKAMERLAKTSKTLSGMEQKQVVSTMTMPTLNIILPPAVAAPQPIKDITND